MYEGMFTLPLVIFIYVCQNENVFKNNHKLFNTKIMINKYLKLQILPHISIFFQLLDSWGFGVLGFWGFGVLGSKLV